MTEFFLMAIGILVVVLLSRVQTLDQELSRLRERLSSEIHRLTARLDKAETRPAQTQQTAAPRPASEGADVVEPPPPRPVVQPRPVEETSWSDQFRPTPIGETAEAKVKQFTASIETRATQAKSEESRLSLEEVLAGKWLTWVGSLAVILGAGFFFKYAIDMGWIGQTERVIIGLVVGVAVFAGGVWGMLRDYRWLAMGLIGAAAGILYFDLWAAAKLYEIVAITPAFAAMVIVTAATLIFSTKFEAQPTAVLGLIGGYLTPLVLSTGVDAQWFFFSYLLLLDLGVLAIGVKHHWRPLQLTAFAGTLLLWASWFPPHYEEYKLRDTVILMTAFFAVFVLLGNWRTLIRKLPAEPEDTFLLIATPAVYFATLYAITRPRFSDWQGLMALGMAVFYGALAWLQWSRQREHLMPTIILGGIGITFLVLAPPLQFTGHWVPIVWAMLSLVLAEAGLRCRQPKLLRAGLGLLMVVQCILLYYAVGSIAQPETFQTRFTPRGDETVSVPDSVLDQLTYTGPMGESAVSLFDVVNGRSLTFLVSGIVMAILAWEFRRRQGRDDTLMADEVARWMGSNRTSILATFLAAVPLTVFAMFMVETASLGQRGDWAPISFLSLFTIWGALTALVLMLLARRPGPTPVYKVSMAIFAVTAVFLGISTLMTVSNWPQQWAQLSESDSEAAWGLVLLNPRGVGFLISIAAASLAAWLAWGITADSRPARDGSHDPALILGIYAYVTGLLMLTTEIVAYGSIHGWETKTSLAVTVTWTLYAIATLLVGIRQRSSAIRVLALTLFLIVTTKVFLHDVWFLDRAIRTIAFMLLGVSLLLVSWLYRRYRERIRAWFAASPESPGDVAPASTGGGFSP